jgi:KDO2-lipid IV(A) lauroyltransferase
LSTLILKAISKLPFPALYLLADLGYLILRYVFKLRREVVKGNLRRSFPEKSEEEIETLTNRFYRYHADILLEVIKTADMSQRDLEERMTLLDVELLDDLVASEQPFILVTAHYGNWEWMLHTMGARVVGPVTAIYQPLHNERVNQYMLKTRAMSFSRARSYSRSWQGESAPCG